MSHALTDDVAVGVRDAAQHNRSPRGAGAAAHELMDRSTVAAELAALSLGVMASVAYGPKPIEPTVVGGAGPGLIVPVTPAYTPPVVYRLQFPVGRCQ